jgi:hypothetical protein
LPYSVVFGAAEARTKAALAALRGLGFELQAADTGDEPPATGRRWRARCAECLIAECEHLSRRQQQAG